MKTLHLFGVVVGACALMLVGCDRSPAPPDPVSVVVPAPASTQTDVVVFRGICDASGAVPISANEFWVADDEKNHLNRYDAFKGGAPLASVHLGHKIIALEQSVANDADTASFKGELDLEAATRYQGKSYWLTSHGRNKKGRIQESRFFLLTLNDTSEQDTMVLSGKPYRRLLDDILSEPRFASFALEKAAEISPKEEPGGLNIEGLTARQDGGLLIGFRSPLIDGKALVISLLNPEAVADGQPPVYGDPITLDLRGMGIRALSSWRGRYLIAAGGSVGRGHPAIWEWDGEGTEPKELPMMFPADFNPEAFFTPESSDRIMVLSDDGEMMVGERSCKKTKDPELKQFRGLWLNLLNYRPAIQP